MKRIIPKFSAMVKSGKLEFVNLERVEKWLATLEGSLVSVIIKKWRTDRSDNQNRYYWGVVVQMISDETGYDKEEVHDILKFNFLTEVQSLIRKDGEVVEITRIRSSAKLTTVEFKDFIERAQRWAAETLQLSIPNPNEVDFNN